MREPTLTSKSRRFHLPAGTLLFRVHRKGRGEDEFSPSNPNLRERKGRFDAHTEEIPHYYCALDERTALLESTSEDLSSIHSTSFTLSAEKTKGRLLSSVKVTQELQLLSLREPADVDAAGAPFWLTTANQNSYDSTAQIALRLRHQNGWAQGFIWCSRWNPIGYSIVLFGDRSYGSIVPSGMSSVDLDDPAQVNRLTARLTK